MTSVGIILKTERERQGRETAEIAVELCITQRYLRAIEQDDLSNLPGTFFYKSFVKQYAALLGVDEMLLKPGIASLTAEVEPLPLPGGDPRYMLGQISGHAPPANGNHFATEPDSSPVRRLDPIVSDGNRRYLTDGRLGLSIAGLVAALLLCSGFYAWWNRAPQAAGSASVSQSRPPVVATVSESRVVAARRAFAERHHRTGWGESRSPESLGHRENLDPDHQ